MATDITRIYVVTKRDGTEERLVRAGHKFAAHRHVTTTSYGTRLASQDDIVRLLAKGVQVEQASKDGVTAELFEAE